MSIDHDAAANRPMGAVKPTDVFLIYRASRGWVSVRADQIMDTEQLATLTEDLATVQTDLAGIHTSLTTDESNISDLLSNLESLTNAFNATLDPGIQFKIAATDVDGKVTWFYPHTFDTVAPAVIATVMTETVQGYYVEKLAQDNVSIILQVLKADGTAAPEGVPVHLVAGKVTP
jgi:hypothetical protein